MTRVPAASAAAGTGGFPIATGKKDEARDLAVDLARLLDLKLAENVLVLDMRALMSLTDFFILASARNTRHTQALADDLRKFIAERGLRPLSLEGLPEGRWVLFDCGDVVVHLFDEATRRFYDLEHLWSDAKRLRWKKPAPRKTKPPKSES